MGVSGVLGVRLISFYITVTDSFLLRNERNHQNHPNPQNLCEGAPGRGTVRAQSSTHRAEIEIRSPSKGKEARKPFAGLPGDS